MNAESTYIKVNGVDTFVRTQGPRNASPILLIHGGGTGTSSTVWRYVMPQLARTNFVIAVDAPGFGLSGVPAGDYDVGLLAKHLLGVLDTVDIKSTNLVGHSMGGQIAMRITAEDPSRVRRMALMAIGGRSLGLDYKSPGMALMDRLAVDPDPAMVRELVEMLNFRRDNIQDEIDERIATALRPGVLEAQRKLSAARGTEKTGQQERAAALVQKLRASRVPIMLLWAAQERLNPFDLGESIAKVLDWAEYHVIADAGHNIPNDQPDKVSELLARFLNS